MKLRVRDHNARNPAWKTGREHASGSESRRAFAVVERLRRCLPIGRGSHVSPSGTTGNRRPQYGERFARGALRLSIDTPRYRRVIHSFTGIWPIEAASATHPNCG